MLEGMVTLYVYACREGHRIYRKTRNNPAPCSRCGKPFQLVASVAREPGESERSHEYRALTTAPLRVN